MVPIYTGTPSVVNEDDKEETLDVSRSRVDCL